MFICSISHKYFKLLPFSFLLLCFSTRSQDVNDCYDRNNRPQRCMPPFQNAAFNIQVNVTNTCGERYPIEYCLQTEAHGPSSTCRACDSRFPNLSHPAAYLTDFNNNDNLTWWQSETMLQNIQYPNSINLTLNLGKSFDITYIRLKFRSPRPESFAIYKRTDSSKRWQPYQYYSATCEETYGLPTSTIIPEGQETTAICTSESSDMSPLTGGNIAFSTLEGRPNAFKFENSSILQEWVTATDIRIVLNRLNTFGDEIFNDTKVLKSYYYAISDFAVGGRCKCNGHAKECVPSTGEGLPQRLVCRCEHNTAGTDCERCAPFYNDRPWQRATLFNAFECLACDCHGLSDRCYFDEEMYRRTGHGGHCIECQRNTDGPHCERCKENFYENVTMTTAMGTDTLPPPQTVDQKRRRVDGSDRRLVVGLDRTPSVRSCIPCDCNPTGSLSMQCNSLGKCACKSGVAGDKCDRCDSNFFGFSETGCRPCGCAPTGSMDSPPRCRTDTGQCVCKQNVEGQACDRCKPGYFDAGLFTRSSSAAITNANNRGNEAGMRYNPAVLQSFYYGQSTNYIGAGDQNPYYYPETGQNNHQYYFPQQQLQYVQNQQFQLQQMIPPPDTFGCVKCYCYGHSSICTSSPRYERRDITSDFSTGAQRWRTVVMVTENVLDAYGRPIGRRDIERDVPYSHDIYNKNLGLVLRVSQLIPLLPVLLPQNLNANLREQQNVENKDSKKDLNTLKGQAQEREQEERLNSWINNDSALRSKLGSVRMPYFYFSAPDKYLGDQRFSYDRYLSFRLRIEASPAGVPRPSHYDLVLESSTSADRQRGGGGQEPLTANDGNVNVNNADITHRVITAPRKISVALLAQNNPFPKAGEWHTYRFRLNEAREFGWVPTLDFYDYVTLLSNLTAIRVRAIYSESLGPSDVSSSTSTADDLAATSADASSTANGGGGGLEIGNVPLLSHQNASIPLQQQTLGAGFIDDFVLESAKLGTLSGRAANWVESCTCPKGYVGQFCESCAAGYKRSIPFGGPTVSCTPCECNGHSETCDPQSGACICRHNTTGGQCQFCSPGFWGNAQFSATELEQLAQLTITTTADAIKTNVGKRVPETACRACPCPGRSECFQDDRTQQLICTDCPDGYTGNLCEICADGFYGQPPHIPCRPCDCNGNTDPNSIGNCDRVTGRCLRCIKNTAGDKCQKCLPGFFGNALSRNPEQGGCKPCDCYPAGTMSPSSTDHHHNTNILINPNNEDYRRDKNFYVCHDVTGQCPCIHATRVVGRRCDACAPGFWGLGATIPAKLADAYRAGGTVITADPLTGCRECGCHPLGSHNNSCQANTGTCYCKPGVRGRTCDSCAPNYFGFSTGQGCKECLCDPFGSRSPQCGDDGRCPCKPGVTGLKCDKCLPNKYNLRAGCLDCAPCYGLVQDRVTEARLKTDQLAKVLDEVGDRPAATLSATDADFERGLQQMHTSLDQLLREAKIATGSSLDDDNENENKQQNAGHILSPANIHELAERTRTGHELQDQLIRTLAVVNGSVLGPTLSRLTGETGPALEDLADTLARAQKVYASEAVLAFESASSAATEFGSRSNVMSELSRLSRDKIESLTAQVDMIHELANEARNITLKTDTLAQSMVRGQTTITQDIEDLTKKFLETQQLYNQTVASSQEAVKTSQLAFDKALALYQEALELKLPPTNDMTDLVAQTDDLTEQTNAMMPVIEEVLTANANLMSRANERVQLLRQLLEQGSAAQSATESAGQAVMAARARSQQAIAAAELTLREAQQTLKTLKDFDKEMNSHSASAASALAQVPQIRSLIQETESKRVETEQKLLAAQSDMDGAKEQAIEARDIAETIREQAEGLALELSDLGQRWTGLGYMTNQLQDNVTRFEKSLSNLESRVQSESQRGSEALQKTEEAQNKASLNLHSVTELLDAVSDIQDQLENLGTVDQSQLNMLSSELDLALEQVKRAGLETRLGQLEKARAQQAKSLAAQDARVKALRIEVLNIEAIHHSLPEGCFKVLKLEP